MLVSDKLAEMNGLKVGSRITGENRANMLSLGAPEEILGSPCTFEIIGVYKINFSDDASVYTSEEEIAENFLFSSYVTDKVIQDIKTADFVDWDYFNIYEDDTLYQDQVKPLRSMILLTIGLLLVFILGVLLILGLLITLWIKNRRHEMGIYLSIGLKKSSILRQLITEIILLALLAFTLAAAAARPLASVIGNPAADSVVQKETEEQYVPVRKYNDYFKVEKIASGPVTLEYAVTGKEIAIGGAILLVAAVSSTVLSAGSLLRFKPKELLY